eukprot:3402842-Lingulodinium_polyedra.AAC.1
MCGHWEGRRWVCLEYHICVYGWRDIDLQRAERELSAELNELTDIGSTGRYASGVWSRSVAAVT